MCTRMQQLSGIKQVSILNKKKMQKACKNDENTVAVPPVAAAALCWKVAAS